MKKLKKIFFACIICLTILFATMESFTGFAFFSCLSYGKETAQNITYEELTSNGFEGSSSYLLYEETPQYVIDAFVAVEDRSFWDNPGYDIKGMARVAFDFVKSGGKTRHGASTITQQLARHKCLTLDRTVQRKVKEIAAARELTKLYTKEQIMEFYINMCCYANGIFGIKDAADIYLGKEVPDLSLSEIAYLCSIPNLPEYYDPFKNPETALERRDKILGDMLDMGYISNEEYQAAIGETIHVLPEPD